MKRLPLLGLVLALAASCGISIENSGQDLACFDTGSGMKCVPLDELPAGTEAMCIDTDGETDVSQSSASGVSLSDNATSESSDAQNVVLPTEGDDGDDDDGGDDDGGDDGGTSDSSTEDASGASDSTEEACGTGVDTDNDGTSDSKDCDCLDADTPTNMPPAGGGGGGPVIL